MSSFFDALSRFHRITSAVGGAADEISRALLGEGVKTVGALAGGLFMLDETGANLELRVAVQYPEPLADRYRLIPMSANVPLVDTVKTMTPVFLGSLDEFVMRYPDFAKTHPEIARNAFVSLPLALDGRCVGGIALGFDTPRTFTTEERDYLVVLGDQCANALERAQRTDRGHCTGQRAEPETHRLELLHAFTGALAQATIPEQVGEAVVDMGMAATSAKSTELWLLSHDGASVVLSRGVGPGGVGSEGLVRVPIDGPERLPILDALRDGVAVWIESKSQLAERYPGLASEPSPTGEVAIACVPLFAQGRCIGGLVYHFEGVRRFLEEERAFLQLVAWYSAQAIERARLFAAEKSAREQAERNQKRSDFLADVSVLLASSLDYSNILEDIAQAAVPRFVDWCVLELVHQRIRTTPPVARHADPSKVPLVLEMRRRLRGLRDFDRGIAAVMRSGQSQRHASITRELIEAHSGGDETLLKIADDVGVASALVVPISARGQVLGAILLSRAKPTQPFDDVDLAMAEELGRRVGLAVDNARLYQEARDADRLKDEFLAMLSHELRNPLAPILLALELMERGGEPTFARERAVISRQVRHVVRLIEDLLDVARIARGKVQLETKRCELASILAAAVEMANPIIEANAHRLVFSCGESGLLVMADHARLTQAIANLLTNAAKYTEPGGAIDLGATAEGNDVIVRVRDSGVGIAPELLPRIFELFVQAASGLDRSQGGLGIGLTVVKRVVELHGGTVSAHSAGIGRGSEFVIRLPRAEPDVVVTGAVSSNDAGPAGDRCPVLVVDDNHDGAVMLGQALEALGYSALVVHDGVTALTSVGAFKPQIALLDIGLPGMDGYELARRLRQSPTGSSLRIIAVTGYGQPADRERSREAGFDDHILKPPTLDTLQRVLARWRHTDD